MRSVVKCFAVLATALALACASGCASVTLLQLDNEWARTYEAMSQAGRQSDFIATLSSYDAQLADLASRAAAAGDKAQDPATAVGFYRVAALSAWKSGPIAQDRVPRLTEKGRVACQRLPQKDASQPRDCALFRLIDHLADYDAKARTIASLKASGDPLPRARHMEAADTIVSVAVSIARIDEARSATSTLPLPDEFFDYVRTNMRNAYCTIHGLAGLVFAGDPAVDVLDRVRQAVLDSEARLKTAKASTECAGSD